MGTETLRAAGTPKPWKLASDGLTVIGAVHCVVAKANKPSGDMSMTAYMDASSIVLNGNAHDRLVAALGKMIDYADTWRAEMEHAKYSPLDVDPCIADIKAAKSILAEAAR
jgi:hypothetical protein